MNQDLTSWDTGADDYLSVASSGDAFKEYVDDPAFLELIGNVQNKRVLDIGCGDGTLCQKLRLAGADVIGVDGAPNMIRSAQNKDPKGDYRVLDLLGEAWPFTDASFDVVTAKMMLMNVEPLDAIASRVKIVLKPGGVLAVDVLHPFKPLLKQFQSGGGKYKMAGTYFEQVRGQIEFAGKDFAFYYRPVEQYVNFFLDAGLTLVRMHEVGITEVFARQHPKQAGKQAQPVSLHLLFRS